MQIFDTLGNTKTELEFSEKEGEKILWLPSSNSLKEEDVMSITEYINSGF